MSSAFSNSALEELLTAGREIATLAARKILAIYDQDFDVVSKADTSPLTEADMAAHATIVAGLEKLTPSVPILSEESAAIPPETRRGWPRYWLVDPLDGTKEFIKRNGEFTVNIALIEGHTPILGVVHVPVTNTCYFAARGVGASKQAENSAALPLGVRRANSEHLVVAGSRSHGGEELERFVQRLPGKVELMSRGSSLKLCLVAEGLADIYPRFGPTSEWDTAAAQCVVEQAGGAVTDLNFEALRYNTKPELLNPHFLVIADQSFEWRKYLSG